MNNYSPYHDMIDGFSLIEEARRKLESKDNVKIQETKECDGYDSSEHQNPEDSNRIDELIKSLSVDNSDTMPKCFTDDMNNLKQYDVDEGSEDDNIGVEAPTQVLKVGKNKPRKRKGKRYTINITIKKGGTLIIK